MPTRDDLQAVIDTDGLTPDSARELNQLAQQMFSDLPTLPHLIARAVFRELRNVGYPCDYFRGEGDPHVYVERFDVAIECGIDPLRFIDRHPLTEAPDFDQIRRDVQYCRISWPLWVVIQEDEDDCLSRLSG